MRMWGVGWCACALGGCTAFPHSPEQAAVDVGKIVKSIECELAAAARDPRLKDRHFSNFNAAADLDITLLRIIGADGNVRVTAPYGPAGVSWLPKVGGGYEDLRTNSVKIAIAIPATQQAHADCTGDNPSETNMGLANWVVGTLEAIPSGQLVSISFTKQFKIAVNGSARFGYTLIPVVNTVLADAGFGASRDYTSRFTVALTPPPSGPPKPLKVEVTNWQRYRVPTPEPKPPVEMKPNFSPSQKGPDASPLRKRESGNDRDRPARDSGPRGLSPRERVQNDPELQMMLQRKSPVILAPQ